MNSNNRIAATLFPRDIVCLRNVSINTVHKEEEEEEEEEEEDNNNNNYYYLRSNCLVLFTERIPVHRENLRNNWTACEKSRDFKR